MTKTEKGIRYVFYPYKFDAGKKIFYISPDAIVEKIDNIINDTNFHKLIGNKCIYKDVELICSKYSGYYILEKPIPTDILVIRSFLSQLISIMRAIAPIMIIEKEDISGKIYVTFVDDLTDPKIVIKSEVSMEDTRKYGQQNRLVDLVVNYYEKCKENNYGWNRPKIPSDD